MKNVISIHAWDKEIFLLAMIENRLVVELLDERDNIFSPLRFEHDRFAQIPLSGGYGDIDEIGIVSDCISGSYGKEYFSSYFVNAYGRIPTILDRLSFIGSNGLGALEFKPSDNSSSITSKDLTFSLLDFKSQSLDVYNNVNMNNLELAKLFAKSNSGAGGAKAKAIVDYNPVSKMVHLSQGLDDTPEGFKKAIIKFNGKKESLAMVYNNELRLEYVYYLLAQKCGVTMSPCYLECDEAGDCYFITERFDVDSKGERLHLHSLAGLLGHNAESFTMDYGMLFRMGNALSVSKADKEQMFKSMVFNLVFANKDDHSRNFSFLMDRNYNWSYAPSYDLTYSGSNYNKTWHQLTIDNKPSNKVRSLGINKIAKICDVQNPLEILHDFIDIKHQYLRSLSMEYEIDADMVDMIFEDTKEIDKMFYKRGM